jgi:hypothetical protein
MQRSSAIAKPREEEEDREKRETKRSKRDEAERERDRGAKEIRSEQQQEV